MIGDSPRETRCHTIERFVPACTSAADLREQQPSVGRKRAAERHALRAKPAVIGRMVRIARDHAIRRDSQPATDAAIRTGGADYAACHRNPPAAVQASASDIAAISACASMALARSAKSRPKTI